MTSFATQSNIDMGGPGLLGSDVSGASRRKSKLITIGAGLTLSGGVLVNTLDLSGYVPYTGATTNLNLGAYAITCGAITASGPIQETPTQSALDPTITDIPTGKRMGWYNSTSGEFRDWVNIGGTLKKSAAYT